MALLGLAGGIGTPRGPYAGKVEQEIVEVAAQPTGGWLVDPYGYEGRRRERIREQEQAEAEARAAIERAQDAARTAEAKQAQDRTERAVEATRLAREEVERLIDALEAQSQRERIRKMAAVLLLM